MGHIVLFVDGPGSFLHSVTWRAGHGRSAAACDNVCWRGAGEGKERGGNADVCGRYGGVYARCRFGAFEGTLGRTQPVPRTAPAPTPPPITPTNPPAEVQSWIKTIEIWVS